MYAFVQQYPPGVKWRQKCSSIYVHIARCGIESPAYPGGWRQEFRNQLRRSASDPLAESTA